jgi:hypothetical protein
MVVSNALAAAARLRLGRLAGAAGFLADAADGAVAAARSLSCFAAFGTSDVVSGLAPRLIARS